MRRFWIHASIIFCTLASLPALPAGSVEAGASKIATCAACHGANGNSINPEWPSLAGIGADYIAEQLKNFKDGKRVNPIMMPMATPLTPEDMADIGAYFDSLTNLGLEADPSFWQAGEKLYRGGDSSRGIPACMACHGPTAKGNGPAKFPALRGQQSVYVVKQLKDYASGARTTGPNGVMQTISGRLSADDIRNVASYVQGIR